MQMLENFNYVKQERLWHKKKKKYKKQKIKNTRNKSNTQERRLVLKIRLKYIIKKTKKTEYKKTCN